jgi:hypothetical protein
MPALSTKGLNVENLLWAVGAAANQIFERSVVHEDNNDHVFVAFYAAFCPLMTRCSRAKITEIPTAVHHLFHLVRLYSA